MFFIFSACTSTILYEKKNLKFFYQNFFSNFLNPYFYINFYCFQCFKGLKMVGRCQLIDLIPVFSDKTFKNRKKTNKTKKKKNTFFSFILFFSYCFKQHLKKTVFYPSLASMHHHLRDTNRSISRCRITSAIETMKFWIRSLTSVMLSGQAW